MTIQNFFTSRDNNANANTYVGQQDRLWYNITENALYVSDGSTPGGVPVDLATGANATFNIITANSGVISGNLTIGGNISPAAAGKIGGIQPGPGVDISNTGLLTIDSANLSFSFGNFTANNNILTIVNSDEDMILATQGDAEIQLVGNIGFYKSNGLPPTANNRFFFAQDDGQITILVPNTDPVLGAVQIIGSAIGDSVSPAVAGVMLHITGNPDAFASQYIDGINNFPNYIGRRYNGNVSVPTQVLAGNTIVRFSGQGYSTGGFSGGADGSISLDALEDFTATNQGTIWRFLNNALAGNIRQEVANISVANGVTATQFTTTGNVTAGNLTLSTGGIVSSTGLISTTANILAGNVLSTGAVTSNSASAGMGYRVGAGGTVTQDTSKSTPVTLNTITGEITMSGVQLGGDTTVSFTLNNSQIGNTDLMVLNQVSDANIGFYSFNGQCNSGNAVISVHNMTNTNRSDAIVIRFAVIRGATA